MKMGRRHTQRTAVMGLYRAPLRVAAGGVPVDRPLPSAVLDQLPTLLHQPRRLPVIADGRCSVASVLLARGVIPDSHITEQGRQTIDAARRQLGRAMVDKWTEADWVRRVPIHVRGAHMPYDQSDPAGTRRQSSRKLYHHLLTEEAPTKWLDDAVFYLASVAYAIGIFVIYQQVGGAWCCLQIGEKADRHIVLYHVCGHYECVAYDGLRQFPSDHELVVCVRQFAARHYEYPSEDDPELWALEAQIALDVSPEPSSASSGVIQPGLVETPRTEALLTEATQPVKRATPRSKRRGKAKAKRALDLSDSAAAPETAPANTLSSEGIKQLPPLIAQVAEHGPLYERVSFHNHPQWRAANESLWNAYRLASMTGQRSQLTPILLDILQLPRRVLAKLGRSGRAARRRAVAGMGRRLRTEGERLRTRYNCPDPGPSDGQQTQMSTETMANTMAQLGHQRRTPQRVAAVVARGQIRKQAADTTDADSQSDADDTEAQRAMSSEAASSDEWDEPFASLNQLNGGPATDPDSKAARRANRLVQCGQARKAAQVLHSTTQIADLRLAAVQDTMERLHPRPPADSVLPTIPQTAPPSVLEGRC